MTSFYVDAHTHVQFAAFKGEERLVLQRALDLGVFSVNVGTQKNTSRAAVDLARSFSQGVYATVGLHPIHIDKSFHDPHELDGDK